VSVRKLVKGLLYDQSDQSVGIELEVAAGGVSGERILYIPDD